VRIHAPWQLKVWRFVRPGPQENDYSLDHGFRFLSSFLQCWGIQFARLADADVLMVWKDCGAYGIAEPNSIDEPGGTLHSPLKSLQRADRLRLKNYRACRDSD
jgi:hypothetical protein